MTLHYIRIWRIRIEYRISNLANVMIYGYITANAIRIMSVMSFLKKQKWMHYSICNNKQFITVILYVYIYIYIYFLYSTVLLSIKLYLYLYSSSIYYNYNSCRRQSPWSAFQTVCRSFRIQTKPSVALQPDQVLHCGFTLTLTRKRDMPIEGLHRGTNDGLVCMRNEMNIA